MRAGVLGGVAAVALAGCSPAVGTATFPSLTDEAIWRAPDTEASQAVAIADWDGDDVLDLAFAGALDDEVIEPRRNRLYVGDGDGGFTLAWESEEEELTFGLAWGDMDGDGAPDLAVANEEAPDRVYLNTGGGFVLGWAADSDEASFDLAWGDLDGDGDLDLATASIDGGNRVYENVSGTLASAPLWTAPHSEETAAVAWADVDGDGDLDLACANEDGPNRLYRNDDGALVSAWESSDGEATLGLAWGDVDDDGWPDLAVINEFSGVSVHRNDGGTLEPAWAWSQPGTDDLNSDGVAWGDFDGDGLLDLVVVGQERDRVWRNAGDGSFTPWWRSPSEETSSGVAVADLDGDGDVEIAVAIGTGPDAVFDNPTAAPVDDDDSGDDDDSSGEPGCGCASGGTSGAELAAWVWGLFALAAARRRYSGTTSQ